MADQPQWFERILDLQLRTKADKILDGWVEWMVAAGAADGPCAFDGWEVVGGIAAPG